MTREQTRLERYRSKQKLARSLRCAIATVEFKLDANVGMIVRSAACFGANAVHVIGHVPDRATLRGLSGSTSDFVEIVQYHNPYDFLHKNAGSKIISLELRDNSVSLFDYEFDLGADTIIVAGHEEAGVPEGIMLESAAVVHIPMPGLGFCLNTAMTAHIALYEYTKQALRGQARL